MRRQIIVAILLVFLIGGAFFISRIQGFGGGGTESIGFITGVTTNGNYGVIFDEAEWLTGEDGENAAIEAGLCAEGTRATCLPNDYIIRNVTTTTRTYEFATNVVIVMQSLRMETEGVKDAEITRQEFEQLINGSRAHWDDLPYRITVKNGLITRIEEVYVP